MLKNKFQPNTAYLSTAHKNENIDEYFSQIEFFQYKRVRRKEKHR